MFKKIFSLLISLGFLWMSGCSKPQTPPCDVLVSIPPYLYFIQQLTSGTLHSVSLAPEGANPHLYEPTPKQVKQAKNAKVWIRLSEHFEQKIAHSLQEQNTKLLVVNLAEGLASPATCHCHHCHQEEHQDLHIWLSLRLAQKQALSIAEALIQAFPEKKELIECNLPLLLEKLSRADEQITQKLSSFAGQAILVSHEAFSYFCQDYQLVQLSVESEGKDPLPRQVSSIIQSAKKLPIRTVLTQAQYNNKGAELLAHELNLPIHSVDPYSSNYLDNFLHIAHLIEQPHD